MSRAAIRTEGLGKRYRIGGERQKYRTLRESIVQSVMRPIERIRNPGAATHVSEDLWALRGLDLEIREGEVVGVIGRNGSGKSTLLKVLSRITEPTEGRVEVRGRVGSLLEVGTGFHPELTGRENIYLNGAILGMRRREIAAKFDEIVAFAETEKFLDTPVKRYSSGMYVRLAFAVAAHLDTEILLVDEVLAVGDAAFQQKCLGKMSSVAEGGRTVLFVSHNMTAVTGLCEKGVLLDGGRVGFSGRINETVDRYLESAERLTDIDLTKVVHGARPRHFGMLTRLSVFNEAMEPSARFEMGEPMVARISVHIDRRITNTEVGLQVNSRGGTPIHYFCSTWEGVRPTLEPGDYVFEVRIPSILLFPGTYLLGAWLSREAEGLAADDNVQDVTLIEVVGSDVTGHAADFDGSAQSGCEVYAPSSWDLLEQLHGSSLDRVADG